MARLGLTGEWPARLAVGFAGVGLVIGFIGAIHWVRLAAALYAVGSAMWAGTLGQHDPLFALLDRLGLISSLLFLVAPVAFRTDRQRSHLLVGLVVIGAYLGITALLEEVDLNQLIVPDYITDPTVGIHFNRARGPFVEAAANGLALYGC